MLLQPLTDKLRDMRFYGLLSGLQEQSENPEYKKLSFEERLGMLVDTEWAQRKERRLKSRIKKAKLIEVRSSISAKANGLRITLTQS